MLTIAALCPMLGGCGEEPPEAPVDPIFMEFEADNVIFGFENQLTRDGVRQARVRADTAFSFQDSANVSILHQLELIIYTEDGTERARLTSEWGRLESDTQTLLARGNVVLILQADNRRIEGPELHLDVERGRIWSDSTSTFIRGEQVTIGDSFESDLEFSNVVIRGGRGGKSRVRF